MAVTHALENQRLRHVGALRATAVAPAVMVLSLAVAAVLVAHVGLPLRDPGGVARTRLGVCAALVTVLGLIDRVVRPSRWSWARAGGIAAAVIGFHGTYLAYRNVKSVAPLLRPDVLSDRPLDALDHHLAAGHAPSALLHDLLGTGASASVLSAVYLGFFVFIPVVLATSLVLAGRAAHAQTLVVALCLNWVLGAVTYLLLPSIGPFHDHPALFAALPHTGATGLQEHLMAERASFLADPSAPSAAQSVGAFASLHTSVTVTVTLAAWALRWPRVVRIATAAFAVLTVVATVYFGWHYLADDLAGVVLAVAALAAALRLTGTRRRVPT